MLPNCKCKIYKRLFKASSSWPRAFSSTDLLCPELPQSPCTVYYFFASFIMVPLSFHMGHRASHNSGGIFARRSRSPSAAGGHWMLLESHQTGNGMFGTPNYRIVDRLMWVFPTNPAGLKASFDHDIRVLQSSVATFH